MPNFFEVNGGAVNGDSSAYDPTTYSFRVIQNIIEPVTYSFKVEQSIYDEIPDWANPLTWALRVILNGEDISARLVGSADVEMEEGMARTAVFRIRPAAGSINPNSWTGTNVSIDYLVRTGAVINYAKRLFTGIVDEPVYDLIANLVTFNCTDDLQTVIRRMTREQIDLLTPTAYYSDRLSGEEQEGWDYLEERMKTIPASLDLNEFRTPRGTFWQAKTSADKTFSVSQVIDGTPQVKLATAKSIANRIDINFTYRYQRLKEKIATGGWDFPGSFCDYLIEPRNLPNRDMILGALESTGWVVKDIAFEDLLPTGLYSCPGGDRLWVIGEELRNYLVFGASWQLAKRYSQTVSEVYNVSINAPQSAAQLGFRPEVITGGFTAEYNTDIFENSTEVDHALTGTTVLGGSGDLIKDQTALPGFAREDAEYALNALIQEATVKILDSHRANTVSFDVPLYPFVDVTDTIAINWTRLQAKGKVRRFVHNFDIDSGQAITSIQLAISRRFVAFSVVEEPLTPPAAPETTARDIPPGLVVGAGDSQWGGKIASGSYDPEQSGFSGNYQIIEVGAEFFPVRFQIDTDAIEEDEINENEFIEEKTVNIPIPEDTLVVVA